MPHLPKLHPSNCLDATSFISFNKKLRDRALLSGACCTPPRRRREGEEKASFFCFVRARNDEKRDSKLEVIRPPVLVRSCETPERARVLFGFSPAAWTLTRKRPRVEKKGKKADRKKKRVVSDSLFPPHKGKMPREQKNLNKKTAARLILFSNNYSAAKTRCYSLLSFRLRSLVQSFFRSLAFTNSLQHEVRSHLPGGFPRPRRLW